MILLVAGGLEWVGQVFLSRTEKVLIPTLVVLGIGYHTFFLSHQQMRDQQAFSRQLSGVADLVTEHVPHQSAVLLGKHHSILLYLNALDRERGYLPLNTATVSLHQGDLPGFLAGKGVCPTSLWIDPVLASTAEGGSVVEKLLSTYRSERILGANGSELARINLTASR